MVSFMLRISCVKGRGCYPNASDRSGARFAGQQPFLQGNERPGGVPAACVPAQIARADHAMAWDGQGPRVSPHRLRRGSNGAGASRLSGQPAVGASLAARDSKRRAPARTLERRSGWKRQSRVDLPAAKAATRRGRDPTRRVRVVRQSQRDRSVGGRQREHSMRSVGAGCEGSSRARFLGWNARDAPLPSNP